MKVNQEYFYSIAQDILKTPSPSGFCHQVIENVRRYADELGLKFYKTNKGNGVIEFEGENKEEIIGLAAHVDTLGLMVRSVNSDGTLRVTSIGGNQSNSLISEYCTVHTRTNKSYTGTVLTTSFSTHVHDDVTKKGQKIDELIIRLDEVVKTQKDTYDLGINNGDFISIDPKTIITDNGFIKSRYLDDKISVAIILSLFKTFKEENIKPKHTIKFIISTYEEVGHGCAFIPGDIKQLIAVDMGCIGKDLSCTEYDVSICPKDSSGPYDYEMTTKLIEIAKKEKLNHAVDIYPFYASDATAALRAGNDIKAALIGPGVHASHGMERTHYDACINTIKLLYHYLI